MELARVLSSPAGFDYWESGMDIHLGDDLFDSFTEYQTRMLSVFDTMIDEYGFEVIDAERQARDAETQAAIAEDTARQARLDLLAASGRFP